MKVDKVTFNFTDSQILLEKRNSVTEMLIATVFHIRCMCFNVSKKTANLCTQTIQFPFFSCISFLKATSFTDGKWKTLPQTALLALLTVEQYS